MCCAGSRLLVQENVKDVLLEKLKRKMGAELSLDPTTSGSTRCLASPALSLTQRSMDRDASPQVLSAWATRLIRVRTRSRPGPATPAGRPAPRAAAHPDVPPWRAGIDCGAVVDRSQYDSVHE